MSKYTWIGIIVLALVLAVFTVIGDHGLIKLATVNAELRDIEDKNRTIESNIADLKSKIFAVQNHDLTLEKKAREELGLARKGEVIYIFPEVMNSSHSQDALNGDASKR